MGKIEYPTIYSHIAAKICEIISKINHKRYGLENVVQEYGSVLGCVHIDTSTPLDRGMVLLQLCRWQFSHKETVAEFIQLKLIFDSQKMTNILFERPFRGLGG